jgi:mannose-6-phosphate isomerase-like protein (cupin superfamily)
MNTLSTNFLNLPTAAESANTIDALPREITNSITGDKFKIIHSIADGFDSVKIQFTLPPKAKGAPLHYHLNFVETFEVTSGNLEMSFGDAKSKRIVSPGELVTVKQGTLHSFNNPHHEPVTFVSEAPPAAEFEKFIRSMYGLANDGKTNKDGMPTNFLHLALILDYADLNFPNVPRSLQNLVRKTLTGFARKMGTETNLKTYFEQ